MSANKKQTDPTKLPGVILRDELLKVARVFRKNTTDPKMVRECADVEEKLTTEIEELKNAA